MKSQGQIFIFSILKTFTAITFLNFCCILSAQQLLAQVIDDFEDNDLTVNPSWTGSLSAFSDSSGVLSLDAEPVSGSSYLSTASTASAGSWRCFVHLGFNPSSSNFVRIFVQSDMADLSADLNGFYIQVGSGTDDISLFRQSGSTRTKIIDGIDGKLNLDEVNVVVKATRSTAGEWSLFVDDVLEGSGVDASNVTPLFSGIQCTYTATRSSSFSFDNFLIQPEIDLQSPIVREIKIISPDQLEILFSEILDVPSALDVSNYKSTNAGEIETVMLLDDHKTVQVHFKNNFPERISCTLEIENVRDAALNVIEPTSQQFFYDPPVVAAYKDLVISEIMCDYGPENGLPSAEFIELFNRSEKVLNLNGWTISDGTSEGKIPEYELKAGAYIILVAQSAVDLFESFGQTLGVASFPSLNNGGDQLALRSPTGLVIDSLAYSESWYKSTEKAEGGWSLEIIDPDNFCGEETNWTASENENGGTPGSLNSVDAENIDLRGPELISAVVIAPDTILLSFDEKLSAAIPSPLNFVLDSEHEVERVILFPSLKALLLKISPSLEIGDVYDLSIQRVFDCSGNELAESSNSRKVIFPDAADSLDILFNEVLFNPRSTGPDFIEIINTSPKYIDLSGWKLANLSAGKLENIKTISSDHLILEPFGILALSGSPDELLNEYPLSPRDRNRLCALPQMSDDHGSVAVIDSHGKVMDHLEYDEGYHSIFLKDKEGVSLERLSIAVATNTAQNWKSSSGMNGFASPGFVNSNQMDQHNDGTAIKVDPEIFIPKTGQPDFTTIQYSFDEPGLIATVRIFDFNGRTIKTIGENLLLGTNGFFRWDGDRDDGSKAMMGSYMLQFETYNAEGVVKRIRKRVAIAGNF